MTNELKESQPYKKHMSPEQPDNTPYFIIKMYKCSNIHCMYVSTWRSRAQSHCLTNKECHRLGSRPTIVRCKIFAKYEPPPEQKDSPDLTCPLTNTPSGIHTPTTNNPGIQIRIDYLMDTKLYTLLLKTSTNTKNTAFIFGNILNYCWGFMAPSEFRSIWYGNNNIHNLVKVTPSGKHTIVQYHQSYENTMYMFYEHLAKAILDILIGMQQHPDLPQKYKDIIQNIRHEISPEGLRMSALDRIARNNVYYEERRKSVHADVVSLGSMITKQFVDFVRTFSYKKLKINGNDAVLKQKVRLAKKTASIEASECS